MEEELFKKLSREWIQTEKYDEYLEEIKERSAKCQVLFSQMKEPLPGETQK